MFPKGNLNRVWLVLGALDALDKPTLVNITKATGMAKSSVNDVLIKLVEGQAAGVSVEKIGTQYKVTEWLDTRKEVNKIDKKSLIDEHVSEFTELEKDINIKSIKNDVDDIKKSKTKKKDKNSNSKTKKII